MKLHQATLLLHSQDGNTHIEKVNYTMGENHGSDNGMIFVIYKEFKKLNKK